MTKHLTIKQLKGACKLFPYRLLRFESGQLFAINTKVSDIALKTNKRSDYDYTDFVSYVPCSFNNYISHKRPFMSSKINSK